MKKITMLVFLSFCAIGFSQNSQDQNKEIKAPTGLYAQTAELPAAYFNNAATTQGENAGVANNGQRNTNVTVPFTGTYYNNRPDAMIYDNGPYWNVAGTPNASLLETTLGMNTLGAGAQFTGGNSVADDVVFAEDVEITSIDVFAYQSFETAPTVTGIYLQVWDGDPSGGASVIWGDLGTNILADAVYADANRTSETDPTSTDRQLNRVTANTAGLTLTAGTYWIEYTFEGSGSSGPWAPPIVILGETTTGNALQNQNGTWVILEDSGTFTPQGLPFVIYGEFTGGGGSFPDPYCAVDYSTVEPITLVEVAGISNRSSEVIDGSPAHEDFTAIVGNMEEGQSYTIALEGNTAGTYTCSFTVFIDWNQDGILDNASERYEIGTIENSTGTDGQQATNTITVPAGVTEGPTRMRVMKKFSDPYSVDSCTGTSWGQAEDYTINVTSGGGTGGPCDQEHPLVGDAAGGSGSSQDSDFTTAADIVVVAGEDFTIDTIEVPFLTFAPEDPPISATIVYYDDAAGLPGMEIGSETVTPVILSSAPWVNPVAYEFQTRLDLTPFTFDGDATIDTTYWISITMGTATNQGTVFWEYTNDTPVEGQPYAKFDATIGDWAIDDPTQEVVYSFMGECTPLSVADNMLSGFTYYPNPTSGSLSLKSVNNIDSVSFFNLLGQKVLDVKIGATTSDINLSGLNTGTYIMKVSVEGQIGTYKVLKN